MGGPGLPCGVLSSRSWGLLDDGNEDLAVLLLGPTFLCVVLGFKAYPSRLVNRRSLLGMAADLWGGLGEPTHQQP